MKYFFKNKCTLLFLLIPFFKPICFQYFTNLTLIENGFVIWKIVAAIIILLLFIIYILMHKGMPKIIINVFIFEFVIFLSTMINHGYFQRAIIDMVSIVAFCIIIYLGIEIDEINLFKTLSILLTTLMLINLFSIIIYPNGLPADLYTNLANPLFFMTTDNGTGIFIISTMLAVLMYNLATKSKRSVITYFIIICCLISSIFSGSTTSAVSCSIFIIYLLFFFGNRTKKMLNPILWSFIYVIMFVIIISGSTGIFNIFIESVLHKSITFTGRNLLWQEALQLIGNSPYIGYGRVNSNYISIWGGNFSSHNFILELLLQGGIIAFISLLLIIFKAIKMLNRYRNSSLGNILFMALFLIFISLMMEAFVHEVYLYGILILCCELPSLLKKYKGYIDFNNSNLEEC